MRGNTSYEPDTEVLTKKELAKRLKVCERTVETMCNEGTIPRIVFGRNVRFKWSDVLAALEASSTDFYFKGYLCRLEQNIAQWERRLGHE